MDAGAISKLKKFNLQFFAYFVMEAMIGHNSNLSK